MLLALLKIHNTCMESIYERVCVVPDSSHAARDKFVVTCFCFGLKIYFLLFDIKASSYASQTFMDLSNMLFE